MKVVLFLALIIATAFGQTICNKYCGITGLNASTLMTGAVNGVLGLVLADPVLPQWFNGTTPAGATNFLLPANNASLASFVNQVIYFFEFALGCNDSSTIAYGGPSMSVAHATLGINYPAYNAFNQYVCQVLTSSNFAPADVVSVASALNGLGGICTAKDCSNICNKYSVPCKANNNALISTVVNATVMGVLATPLVQFFNGSISGKTNFLTNSGAFNTLFLHLVQFFGSALGCTDGSIGAYAGVDLGTAHAGLGITVAQFNQFNNILLGVLTGAGVSAADVSTVSGVLNGTQSSIVAGSSGSTGGAGGSTGGAGGSTGGAGGSTQVKTTTTTSSSNTGGAVSMIIASLISLLLVVLI